MFQTARQMYVLRRKDRRPVRGGWEGYEYSSILHIFRTRCPFIPSLSSQDDGIYSIKFT